MSLFHVSLPNICKPEMGCVCPTLPTTGTKISLPSSLHKHRLMLPNNF